MHTIRMAMTTLLFALVCILPPTAVAAGQTALNGTIAFTTDVTKTTGVFHLINADGTGMTGIAADIVDVSDVTWSPNGQQVAYIDNTKESSGTLYVMNSDGSQRRQLHVGQKFAQPVWSPDGIHLAAYTRSGDEELHDLAIINAKDGTVIVAVKKMVAERASEPSWSPNGNQIAFESSDGDIYTVDGEGDHLTNVTQSRRWEWYPRWSPDGRNLAYVQENRTSTGWVIRIHALTEGSTKDLAAEVEVHAMAWSPDGRCIGYVNGNNEVKVVEVNSGETRTLYANGEVVVWSPDSQWIAVVEGPYQKTKMPVGFPIAIRLRDGEKKTLIEASVSDVVWFDGRANGSLRVLVDAGVKKTGFSSGAFSFGNFFGGSHLGMYTNAQPVIPVDTLLAEADYVELYYFDFLTVGCWYRVFIQSVDQLKTEAREFMLRSYTIPYLRQIARTELASAKVPLDYEVDFDPRVLVEFHNKSGDVVYWYAIGHSGEQYMLVNGTPYKNEPVFYDLVQDLLKQVADAAEEITAGLKRYRFNQ